MVEPIRGWKPGTEGSTSKQYSTKYYEQSDAAVDALMRLYRAQWAADDLFRAGEGPPIPCYQDPEYFTGDDLKSPREAQLACAGCPALMLCKEYAEVAHPAWGIHGGVQYGHKLAEAMREKEDEND